MTHSNETVIRDAYAAFSRGDLDALRNEAFDPHVSYHIPGNHSFSGEYSGVDAVLDFFVKLAQATNGTFAVDLLDVLANDKHVTAIHTSTAQRDKKEISVVEILFFEMKDGKAVRVWSHPRDQQKLDEFWS